VRAPSLNSASKIPTKSEAQNADPKAVHNRPRLTCPICNCKTEVFFQIEGIPLCCNILWPNREKAVGAPKGEIRLAFCRECGHIYNAAFDPSRLAYDTSYDNSLHFSGRFQEYARDLAARLVATYDLYGKTVIEIGCGSADFLSLLCASGHNRGIGFDPSFIPGRVDLNLGKGIEIVRENYSERYANRSCDLLCSRHMLEHVPEPVAMITSVSQALKENPRAAVYFEVPNALFSLEENGIWDIIYEHCSYFTPHSIYRLFANAGFGILGVEESFGRQFLSLEALVSNEQPHRYSPAPAGMDRLADEVSAFSSYRTSLVNRWMASFDEMRSKGQRAVTWGAGAKGTIFLNILGGHASVEYVVDINPNKQGHFIPGTGQRIIAPEALRDLKPEAVILMNPAYHDEVKRVIAGLGLSPQFLTL
jgi:SAM-dependent methyltransferase